MSQPIFVRFWGVRGSIPTPGPETSRTGGNTSCVELRFGGQRVILDGGSGLRALGQAQAGEPVEATLLFGHLHWDHIQGVPFFGPLFDLRSRLRLVGPQGLHAALRQQMASPVFPVGMEVFASRYVVEETRAGARLELGEVEVTTAPLRHPGGAIGYRVEAPEGVVVYACDHEPPASGPDPALVELARGADLLIADAQYLPSEAAAHRGWGHGTYEQVLRLADAAGVQSVALTHHDPRRSDEEVDAIESAARGLRGGALVGREGRWYGLSASTPDSVAGQR